MEEEEHESHPLTHQESQQQQQRDSEEPQKSRKLSFSGIRILVGIVLVVGIVAAPLFIFLRSSYSPATAREFNSSGGTRDRTGFHFQPPRNWMNDPNGPVFYSGYYHLFYQFNPRGAIWDEKMSWGHAVSTDLIHWTHLPVALEPSEWYDSRGCWSGSVTLVDRNKPVILYTGISKSGVQTQNAAVPEDPADPLLRKWMKLSQNPLIPEPPEGIGRASFRDPSTAWRDPPRESPWRVVIGGKNGSSGVGFLYESSDFISWRRTTRPIFSLDGTGMWECPDFFPVSNSRYVFKASLGDPEVVGGVDDSFDSYVIGTYSAANATFGVPDETSFNSSNAAVEGLGSRLDYGNRFYASKTFWDTKKSRRIIWGWLAEADSQADDVLKGWASVQSIPRSIWLESWSGGEEHLMQLPVEEIKTLRIQPGIQKLNTSIKPGSVAHLLNGSEIDVEIIFRLPDMTMQMGMENFDVDSSGSAGDLCRNKGAEVNGILGPFGLLVLATSDMREQTAIFFHPGRSARGLVALVCADQSRSAAGLNSQKKKTNSSMLYGAFVHLTDPSTAAAGYELSLRVLVDRSVVETFAQGGMLCITSRVYPRLATGDAANLFLFNNGSSTVEVKMLNAWNMKTVELSGST